MKKLTQTRTIHSEEDCACPDGTKTITVIKIKKKVGTKKKRTTSTIKRK
jgi:hypothetical protein